MQSNFEGRTGSMTQVVCEDHPPVNLGSCLGSFPVHHRLELAFYKGRFTISTQSVQMTRDLLVHDDLGLQGQLPAGEAAQAPLS